MIERAQTALKAIKELGPQPLLQYAIYRAGLLTGFWQRRTPAQTDYSDLKRKMGPDAEPILCRFPLSPPSQQTLSQILSGQESKLIDEADEICQGKIRLFGGAPAPLEFNPPRPKGQNTQPHWTAYELGRVPWGVEDVKYIWEPGRFCWTYTLGRAYLLTGKEKYPQAFWKLAQNFIQTHPPNSGPHWSSAQEVALRLLALLFADRIFIDSTDWTLERRRIITESVIAHAARIPPTLVYARAQKNNHLLTEALGLYAAGVSLQNWKPAARWQTLGWRLIQHALRTQISPEGVYIQHSANYHRLMLQAALWAQAIAKTQNRSLSRDCLQRLGSATRWLLAQLDPISGQMPNLGHNDGAYILPLSSSGHMDYRPVAQAASRAFLQQDALPPGEWDEFSLWLRNSQSGNIPPKEPLTMTNPAVPRLGDSQSWATLRAARFKHRPAHADQLHVDLWWQGTNVATDAGTYLYNAPSPWQNSLAHTAVHNTLTVENKDQMQHAGRFLWLDWAQARQIQTDQTGNQLSAEHNGYRKLGVTHRRTLIHLDGKRWLVRDDLLPSKTVTKPLAVCVNWLLQDWPWKLQGNTLHQDMPHGNIQLCVSNTPQSPHSPIENLSGHQAETTGIQIIRAGEVLHGTPDTTLPYLGWVSPTYGIKLPAIAFRVTFQGKIPFSIFSEWTFSR